MYFEEKADDKLGKVKDPLVKAVKYVKTRGPKEKLIMLGVAAFVVRDSVPSLNQRQQASPCTPVSKIFIRLDRW